MTATITPNRPDFVIGVDPGLSGAIALYNVAPAAFQIAHGGVLAPAAAMLDMPVKDGKVDAHGLAQLMDELSSQPFMHVARVAAVIENVSSRPRQAGAFSFGMSTGIVHGVLAAMGLPITVVAPSVWKPAMGLRRDPHETERANKSRARALAKQLFPAMAKQFDRIKDDGRAEALLLAVYHANTFTGATPVEP